MCSIVSGLWCWDATTQAASDDAPSQRQGLRGVLSFSFKVGVRQGRVTLPRKSLRGVRAPNTRKESINPGREGQWPPRPEGDAGVIDPRAVATGGVDQRQTTLS